MKNLLTNPVKKRVISEIRHILYNHPKYREDSNNVQNKFSFEERPYRGVIVNSTSADRIKLSADNYVGCLNSFVMLAESGNSPGTTLEWVRENFSLLEQFSPRRDIFPSPPGVYTIKVNSVPNPAKGIPGYFTIDPVFEVRNEPLITFSSSMDSTAQLSNTNLYPNSVNLYLDGRRKLLRNVDYSIDDESGEVTFLRSTPYEMNVLADYKYRMNTQGPYPFNLESFDATSIPGAVLAFGDRAQDGDELCVVVSDGRVDVAEVYGGKFEVNFDIVAFSRDAQDREKLSDFIIIKMLERQGALGYEGIELLDISPGGENEEVSNGETDEYYYESSLSLSVRVDWETYISLPVVLSDAGFTSKHLEEQTGYLDGSFSLDRLQAYRSVVSMCGGITPLASGFAQPLASGTWAPIGPGPYPVGSGPSITQSPAPFSSGRDITYERIK